MGEALSGLADDSNEGPRDGVLLSQLIQLLSRRPRKSMLLTDLAAVLPGQLRKRAQAHGGLRCWIETYGSLFQVTGEPGKELVVYSIASSAGNDQSWELSSTAQAPAAAPAPAPAPASAPVEGGELSTDEALAILKAYKKK